MSVFGGPRGGLLVLIGLSCQAQEFTQVASFPYATAVNSWQVMGKVASDKKKVASANPLDNHTRDLCPVLTIVLRFSHGGWLAAVTTGDFPKVCFFFMLL
jgi:hypothetical protein